jgi:Uma2 family endonuclease
MTVDTKPFTADELLDLPADGWRYELVKGELRKMSPAGSRHGLIAARLIASLLRHVEQEKLGAVYSSETGFLIARDPDSVLAPDASFLRSERALDTDSYFPGPPDLAVEVISPNDRYSEVQQKTEEWLRAGVRAVIVVDPRRRIVTVHRPSGEIRVDEILDVEDVVPGWRLPLSKLFA